MGAWNSDVAHRDAAVPAEGRARRAPERLREALLRRPAPHEKRAEVAEEGTDQIARLERRRRSDGNRLLTERSVEAPRDLPLPVETGEALLDAPRRPHEPVEIEQLLPVELRAHGRLTFLPSARSNRVLRSLPAGTPMDVRAGSSRDDGAP